VAKADGIHLNMASQWPQQFFANGRRSSLRKAPLPNTSAELIAKLEQPLGKKEVDISLPKAYIGRSS
jgi:hypothetical protein